MGDRDRSDGERLADLKDEIRVKALGLKWPSQWLATRSCEGHIMTFMGPRYFRLCGTLPTLKIYILGTSLVVQWLRICLPMQGTQVQFLRCGGYTCRAATKSMHQNYWACVWDYWSPHSGAHALHKKPLQCEAHALQLESGAYLLQLEKARAQKWRPSTAKNK